MKTGHFVINLKMCFEFFPFNLDMVGFVENLVFLKLRNVEKHKEENFKITQKTHVIFIQN